MVIELPLTQGFVSLIDDEDAELVVNLKWQAIRDKRNDRVVAAGRIHGKFTLLHRFLLKPPKELVVDHINHDTLDNRRTNLRVATHSQNAANSRPKIGKFKGVYFHSSSNRWHAHIGINGVLRHLGCFETDVEAARAYDKAALEAHGEFAFLNCPFNDPWPQTKESGGDSTPAAHRT